MYHYVYLISNMVEHKSYFGVRSCNCTPEEDTSYMSSSKLIQKLYKEKPHEFKKKILKIFDTRKEAMGWEIYLHNTYDVGRNPSFYNRAKQTATNFDMSGTIAWNRIAYKLGDTVGNYGVVFLEEVSKNTYGFRRARFKCTCGKEFTRVISHIVSNQIKSCGCRKVNVGKARATEYKVGQPIGDHGVTYYGNSTTKGVRRKECFKCSCGNLFEAQVNGVVSGNTKSCGCHKVKVMSTVRCLYKSGEPMGDFGIIYINDLPKSCDRRLAHFKCHCGNYFDSQISNVKNGSTKSCGCVRTKRKIKEG